MDDKSKPGTTKYMLISVADREILTELFQTLDEAQAQMHKEMIEWGRVPQEIFSGDTEYEDYDYGYGEDCGWANEGINHADYDWRIVSLETETEQKKYDEQGRKLY